MLMAAVLSRMDFTNWIGDMVVVDGSAGRVVVNPKAATLARNLPLALDAARAVLEDIPGEMTRHERGQIHLCYANALTTVAIQRGDPGLFHRSRDAYKGCLALFTEDETPAEWAFV